MENNLFFRWLTSSLGKKVVMALTGLFLCVFLCEHLYTNLLLYAGDGGIRFNEASHTMVHTLLIRIIEVVLFGAILVHIVQAVTLTTENSKARPKRYAVNGVDETSSWFSRNMLPTGLVILFFLIVHLRNFFLPYRILGTVGDGPDFDLTLAQEVASAFTNPFYSALYLAGIVCLALHLNHGFQAAFSSLGLSNRKYGEMLKAAGTGFAVLIGLGFSSFPILFFLSSKLGWDLLLWNTP
jgi:succinate dehydrogenase / fumarate reductase cytochrome b subunit